MKTIKLIYFTMLCFSLTVFFPNVLNAQKYKSGGISISAGISNLGSTQWRLHNTLRIRPYLFNEIGYLHQTIFPNQKIGIEYGFSLRHNRYRIERKYITNQECVQGLGSISIPINLTFGKSTNNKYWYIGAGIALNHEIYMCETYSYYVHYSPVLNDDGSTDYVGTVYEGKEAKKFNYCKAHISQGLWGDVSMSTQIKFGFIQSFKEKHAIGITFNYQMLDLISFDGENFGEIDFIENIPYYYPMNFSIALTWYFKNLLP